MAGIKSQQPDPNMIDIHIEGYSGNCDWVTKGKFDGNEMDPRLMYYMTAEEYQGTLVKLNDELGKQQKSICAVGVVLAVITVIFTILAALIAIFVHSPEVIECGAPKGYCSNTTFSPSADQCCLLHCCKPNEAEHAEAGQFSSAASCYRVGPEWASKHVKGTQPMCSCVPKRKKKPASCIHEVKYEGELKVTAEKNGWAVPVASLIGAVAVCSLIGIVLQCCRPRCGSLQSKLALHWVIWQSKGIAVSFSDNSSKHNKPRLILVMPVGGPHMQGGCVGAMPPPVYGWGAAVQPVLQTTAAQPQPVTVGQAWPTRNDESENPAPLQETVVS